MAIAELCVVRKPVLFVPYPYAAEDHQTVNAKNLVSKRAALMVKDDEALDKVVPMIIELANDENKQNELKKNIGALAIIDADKRIADEILRLVWKELCSNALSMRRGVRGEADADKRIAEEILRLIWKELCSNAPLHDEG